MRVPSFFRQIGQTLSIFFGRASTYGWLIFTMLIAFVSGGVASLVVARRYIPLESWAAAFGATLGIVVFLSLLWVTSGTRFGRYLRPFHDQLTRTGVVVSSVLAVLISVVVATGVPKSLTFLVEPGGLFALAIGWLTIVGVYVTAEALHDSRQRIDSINDFLLRATRMLQEADEEEELFLVAYTVGIGCLAARRRIWIEFAKQVSLSLASGRLKVLCASKSEIQAFHRLFLGRRTDRSRAIDLQVIEEAESEMEQYLVGAMNSGEARKGIYHREASKLPGFYMLAGDHRALVAAPLFMPTPHQDLLASLAERIPHNVRTIGLETGDNLVVEQIREMAKIHLRAAGAALD